jgi:peptide/nickel transport system ATP-binding protein
MTVLYSGLVLEDTTVAQFFKQPQHAYSAALLRATPKYTDPNSSLLPVPQDIIHAADAEVRNYDERHFHV